MLPKITSKLELASQQKQKLQDQITEIENSINEEQKV
jgi:hypothetical protein